MQKYVTQCLLFLLLFATGASNAQVTMIQPMSPARADNVQAEFSGDELVGYTATAYVEGRNENNQAVGYFLEDAIIQVDDMYGAAAQLLSTGTNSDLIETAAARGFVHNGSELVRLQIGFAVAIENVTVTPVMVWGGQASSLEVALIAAANNYPAYQLCDVPDQDYFVLFNADLNPGYSAACGDGFEPPDGVYSAFAAVCNVGTPCEGGPSPTLDEVSDYDALGCLFPLAPGSDDPCSGFGGRFHQQQRSDIVTATVNMGDLADIATDAYESDAYEGFPQFLLFYGFYSGQVDPPADEGDCDPDWCTGGSGGGGGDVDSEGIISAIEQVNDTLQNGLTLDLGEYELAEPETMHDEATAEETGLIECVTEQNEDCTIDTSAVDSFGDLLADYLPTPTSCQVFTFEVIPAWRGYAAIDVPVDTCDFNIVRVVLEWCLSLLTIYALWATLIQPRGND